MSNRWVKKSKDLTALATALENDAIGAPHTKAVDLLTRASALRAQAREEEKAARFVQVMKAIPFDKPNKGTQSKTEAKKAFIQNVKAETGETKRDRLALAVFNAPKCDAYFVGYEQIYRFLGRKDMKD
jgi:hypothetical protein